MDYKSFDWLAGMSLAVIQFISEAGEVEVKSC